MNSFSDSLEVSGGVFTVRPSGSAFFTRLPGDIDARWRVTVTGIHEGGPGNRPPYIAWGWTPGSPLTAGQFFEISASAAAPDRSVGISLNDNAFPAAFGLISKNGYFSINHLTGPTELARVHRNGDVEALTGGFVLSSPNGTRYRIKVDDFGALFTELVQ